MRAFWLATAALAVATPALAQQKPPPAARAQPATPPAAKPAPGSTVGEVVVTGTPPPIRTSIDRQSYSVAGDLQTTTGSIGDALRNIPSVEVDVQGNVALRGDANVTIMIDGKPSGMFRGEGKAQALQSLGADQIDRVEVITNPSAAFNPEGSAGIINLITKKTAKPGLTGSVRLNYGSMGRYTNSLSATRKEGRFTVSGNINQRHDSLKQSFTTDREFVDPTTGGRIDEARKTVSSGEAEIVNGRVGVDFDPDAKTRLNAEVNFNAFNFDINQIEALRQTTAAGATRLAADSLADQRQSRGNVELNLGYRKKYAEAHELNVTFTRELIDEDRSRPLIRYLRLPAAAPGYEDSEFRNLLWRTQIKADYATPLPGSVKLKFGYEFNGNDNDYTVVFGRGPVTGPVAIDATRSNLFRFDQQIHAVFATYERPFGKFTALAGLRVEATQIDLDQVTQNLKSQNDYVRFYPSLHTSYRLDEVQQLSASYSHRVQRPDPQDYNPFRVYGDPQNFRQGNPDLKPQQTDSFELGYQYRKSGQIYLATLYYRSGKDAVNDIFRDLGGGVILQTKVNLGSFQTAGLEVVANGRLPGKLTYNLSGNLLWSEIDARGLGFGAGLRSTYTVFGRGSLNWQATDKDFFQVQGFVNGKRLLSQGYSAPQGGVNLGYRHKFNDKISGVVTVQDALNTIKFRNVIKTPAYTDVIRGEPRQRAIFVGVTYAFGGRQRDPGFDFGGGGGGPPS